MTHGTALEVFLVALRLGLTSFGGPVAHIGYFREEYVWRRRWLDEATFADLVALCQFLPGPASSKVGLSIGIMRAGLLGGLCAWLGFTIPSAAALTLAAFGVMAMGGGGEGVLHGLKVAAVAVVALAVWQMARSLSPDRQRATVAVLAAVATLAWPSAIGQVLTILAAGAIGLTGLVGRADQISGRPPAVVLPFGRRLAIGAWVTFFLLLFALPVLRTATDSQPIAVLDTFYRVGALVFGGGHVILPLLQAEVVPPGWVGREQFVAGYGAAQAVPGPLFTFAAYLGAVIGGWPMAVLALVAIFTPALLLVVGALPIWDALRGRSAFQDALRAVNAAVVGLLAAALYHPVWTSAILGPADLALALVALVLLAFWKVPPWLVVVLAAAGGAALTPL